MNTANKTQRLLSLDVYRGLVMLVLATHALNIPKVATQVDSPWLQWLSFQTSHPEWISQFHWVGFAAWDMIQPAFMFIVGVAVPFSYAKRKSLGASSGELYRHALMRSVLLVLLGVFLQSTRSAETNWIFTNVLAQIGLGYIFLVLVANYDYGKLILVGVFVLVLTWGLYAVYPLASSSTDAAVGDARTLPGFFAHWSDSHNVGLALDRWLLNLFPRSEPWTYQNGYVTLNFVPAFVTMLMGLVCGKLLLDERFPSTAKLCRLFLGAFVLLLLAVVAGETVCPIVKRIWTPSWVLFSGAYVVASLAVFYWLIDVRQIRFWTFPFVVVGLNPLAMYLMGMLVQGWVVQQFRIHLPDVLFIRPWGFMTEALLAMVLFWLVTFWMYRNRVFLRL